MRQQLYLEDDAFTRWSAAAEREGKSVNEWIRATIEGHLEGRLTQAEVTDRIAARVGAVVDAGLLRVQQLLAGGAPSLVAAPQTQTAPLGAAPPLDAPELRYDHGRLEVRDPGETVWREQVHDGQHHG